MGVVKEFLSKKSIGYYLFAGSALLGLLMLIIFVARGGDVLTKIDHTATVLLVIGVIINVALLVKNIKPLEIAPFILYLSAFAVFMSSEITFIGNVITGIDGNYFDAGFMFIAIFGLIAVALGMAASIIKLEKKNV